MLTCLVALSTTVEISAQQNAGRCKINSSSFAVAGGSEMVTYTYNSKNELLKEATSDGSGIVYVHDSRGNVTSQSETKRGMITVYDYAYDADNTLKTKSFTQDSITHTTTYTYTASGNLQSISIASNSDSYPSNDIYTYDDYSGANPKTIYFSSSIKGSSEVTKRKHTYEYDANGNVIKDISYDFSTTSNRYEEKGKGEFTYDLTAKSVMLLALSKKIIDPKDFFQTGLVYYGGVKNFNTSQVSYAKCKGNWVKISEVTLTKTSISNGYATAWTTTTTNYAVAPDCTVKVSKWGNGTSSTTFVLEDCN